MYLTLCHSLDCSPPGSSVYVIFSDKNTGMDCHFSPPGESSHPGMRSVSSMSPALQMGFLPAEPPGKPSELLNYF